MDMHLGWIVSSKVRQPSQQSVAPAETCFMCSDVNVNHQLQCFWELEKLKIQPSNKRKKSVSSIFCVTIHVTTLAGMWSDYQLLRKVKS
jgi:hypothetical protein